MAAWRLPGTRSPRPAWPGWPAWPRPRSAGWSSSACWSPGTGRPRSCDATSTRSAWPWPASGPGCRWTGSPRPSGPAGCRSRSWRRPRTTAGRSPRRRTYRQVSAETGVPLDDLRAALEAMGFAWLSPDEPMREDELEVVPLVRLAFSSGIFDRAWMTRVGRAYAEGLRLAAQVENESYQARFEEPALALRARPAPGHGAGLGAGGRVPAPGRPGADGHLPPPAGAGLDRAPGAERRGRARGGRRPSPGRSGCRRCASSTWPATPGSPRSGATRRPPSSPAPWPCWSSAPRARTGGPR